MGLSAAQARLLTITARKSDCEFQSMRHSHEKIALSRKMTDISNEYQNSLNLTKMVYDFYGNGDATVPLSYNLLMTPSQYNGYMPMITTDSSGKVVLDSKYARAAEAAGIPREGLGALPSMEVRNKFLQGLADSGYITQAAADTYKGVEYSPNMGLGSTDLITTKIEQMNLEDMLDYYASEGESGMYTYDNAWWAEQIPVHELQLRNGPKSANLADGLNLTLRDILTGDYQLLCKVNDYNNGRDKAANAIKDLDLWDWLFSELENMISISGDAEVSNALMFAKNKTKELLDTSYGYAYRHKGKQKEKHKRGWCGIIDAMNNDSKTGHKTWFGGTSSKYPTGDYIGITDFKNTKLVGNNREDGVSIDITNIAKAFLTYYAQCYEGSKKSEYKVSEEEGNRTIYEEQGSHLIDDKFMFGVEVDTGINTDQALISGFYDALFNQICMRGWVEDNNVTDNEYLQEKYKNGMMYLTTCAEDGFYYQENYGTNSYIKEVADDEAIARAEAKYNNEKQKINHKEEIIDMKMKNLDTEITSLTTEYDTVKSLISKNIERGFKRYDA